MQFQRTRKPVTQARYLAKTNFLFVFGIEKLAMLVRLFNPMTIGIARKHERQGAVARDIARSAEAIFAGRIR